MKSVIYKKDYIVYENTQVYSLKRNRFLAHSNMKIGYLSVCIHNKTTALHRIMAECFLPKNEGKNCVNHKDGNKLNNNIDNLEWCSYKDNSKHAWETGLKKYHENTRKGTSIAHSKLVLDTQTGIFYQSAEEAAVVFNIQPKTLRAMLNNKFRNKTNLKWV